MFKGILLICLFAMVNGRWLGKRQAQSGQQSALAASLPILSPAGAPPVQQPAQAASAGTPQQASSASTGQSQSQSSGQQPSQLQAAQQPGQAQSQPAQAQSNAGLVQSQQPVQPQPQLQPQSQPQPQAQPQLQASSQAPSQAQSTSLASSQPQSVTQEPTRSQSGSQAQSQPLPGSQVAPSQPLPGSLAAPSQPLSGAQPPSQPLSGSQVPSQSAFSAQSQPQPPSGAPALPQPQHPAEQQPAGPQDPQIQPQQGTQSQPQSPQIPPASLGSVIPPIKPPPGPPVDNFAAQNPIVVQLEDGSTALLQIPAASIPQIPVEPTLKQSRPFAKGFEARPIPPDPSLLSQPTIQLIGDERQWELAANEDQQNLAVIRPAQEQAGKGDRVKLPPAQQINPDQLQELLHVRGSNPQELRQRIQQALGRAEANNAGRDRQAFLSRVNVTGDRAAAERFIKQLKNLTEFQDKEPFASVEMLKALVNTEIHLAVDNWIINEEVAGQLAATFNIPRESVSAAFPLTATDADELHISGNNPTAGKKFVVQVKELIWTKIDQQYRITTDLLGKISDAFLDLLVGNGIVKEKFASDIANNFYRTSNRKIKLF